MSGRWLARYSTRVGCTAPSADTSHLGVEGVDLEVAPQALYRVRHREHALHTVGADRIQGLPRKEAGNTGSVVRRAGDLYIRGRETTSQIRTHTSLPYGRVVITLVRFCRLPFSTQDIEVIELLEEGHGCYQQCCNSQ